jgi:hypothetical protein
VVGVVIAARPKTPRPESDWTRGVDVHVPGEVCCSYGNGTLGVLSAYGDMEYRGLVVPHFHVSVSAPGQDRRPTDDETELVRRDFDMEDAEEDNHHPGRIRNLFRPIHLPKGTVGICDCKENEEIVTEADGFQWSRAVDGGQS